MANARIYEGDVTRIQRMIEREIRRAQKQGRSLTSGKSSALGASVSQGAPSQGTTIVTEREFRSYDLTVPDGSTVVHTCELPQAETGLMVVDFLFARGSVGGFGGFRVKHNGATAKVGGLIFDGDTSFIDFPPPNDMVDTNGLVHFGVTAALAGGFVELTFTASSDAALGDITLGIVYSWRPEV